MAMAPPWQSPAATRAAGGGNGPYGALANHGKPWDCKAMGTKVSETQKRCYVSPAAGNLVNRLKGRGTKPRGLRRAKPAMAAQPPDTLHPYKSKERKFFL